MAIALPPATEMRPRAADALPLDALGAHPHDPITGLGTRIRLLEDLDALIDEDGRRSGWILAAFELTGDAHYELDHGAGAYAELLGRLAGRLSDAIAGAGTAYRIGGSSFAILARVGRGGSGAIVLAARAALEQPDAGIRSTPLLASTPLGSLSGLDALELLALSAADMAATREAPPQVPVPAGLAPLLATAQSLAGARTSVPRGQNPPPRWLPYLSVSTRFTMSAVLGVLWMAFSAWLAAPWIEQLSRSLTLPGAIALIAGLALIPGYLNVQLVTSLLMDHPRRIDPSFPFAYPSMTLLVAAYNEERTLAQTLAYALEQEYPGGLEVIVCDDGSQDGTADIARGFARLDGRLRLLSLPHGGKASALNAGLAATSTPLVATIDADTLLMPGALLRVVARMLLSPDDTVAVAGSVMVRNSRGGIVAAAQTWDYLVGIGSIKRQQALLQATLVAQGAFSVYDVDAMRAAEGWPDCIGEDIVMTWALLDNGGRTTYEPTAIAFTEAPATLRQLARQRRRWARGMIEGLRKYGIALVRKRKVFAHSVIADAMFPYLDLVFTCAFLPGIVLAATGNFAIVGPMTLAVLPLNAVLAYVMFRRQRDSLKEAGLSVRRATAGLFVFFLLYQAFMSPVSVSGYAQELFGRRRRW